MITTYIFEFKALCKEKKDIIKSHSIYIKIVYNNANNISCNLYLRLSHTPRAHNVRSVHKTGKMFNRIS